MCVRSRLMPTAKNVWPDVYGTVVFSGIVSLCVPDIVTGFCLSGVNYVEMGIVDRFRLCFDLCYPGNFPEFGLNVSLNNRPLKLGFYQTNIFFVINILNKGISSAVF